MKLYKHINRIVSARKRILLSHIDSEDEIIEIVEGLFRETTEWDTLWFMNFNSPEEFRACYRLTFLRWVNKLTPTDLIGYLTEHQLMDLFQE